MSKGTGGKVSSKITTLLSEAQAAMKPKSIWLRDTHLPNFGLSRIDQGSEGLRT